MLGILYIFGYVGVGCCGGMGLLGGICGVLVRDCLIGKIIDLLVIFGE